MTGASGLIGGLVLANLADRYELSGLSRHAVPGIPYTVGSITDRDSVRRAVAGQDMVLHLAGETPSLEWDEQFEVTAGGTINVLANPNLVAAGNYNVDGADGFRPQNTASDCWPQTTSGSNIFHSRPDQSFGTKRITRITMTTKCRKR